MGDEIKKELHTNLARVDMMVDDMSFVTKAVDHFDRLQAPGDPEYDFHFGGERQTETAASKESLTSVVAELSTEIGGLFTENMSKIEQWQDSFEKQQHELHSMITEMQVMVKQEVACIGAITGAVAQLSDERVL